LFRLHEYRHGSGERRLQAAGRQVRPHRTGSVTITVPGCCPGAVFRANFWLAPCRTEPAAIGIGTDDGERGAFNDWSGRRDFVILFSYTSATIERNPSFRSNGR